jgi:putative ABC transport system substrate-binding protein
MNRRHALRFAISACVAARASPLWAQSPLAGPRRVGVLVPSTRAKEEVILKPFFDQMRETGWVEGRNIVYDRVYADDRHHELPRLAAELVARKPELIYAPPQIASMAASQATRTTPIVFATAIDPVGAGLASSLAHPGGNVTGVVSVIDSLAPKRLELLRQILPNARRIGLLGDPNDPRLNIERSALASVASALSLSIVVAEATNPADLAIEQPTRFELVINMRAAKALGIVIPRSVLLRADEVIQ